MTLSAAKLRFLAPTEALVPGRGFYQLEEDALYVQLGAFDNSRRFFSYLEADFVRLDIDRQGRLIFIEVDLARRQWPVDEGFCFPENVEQFDIRWLDFRCRIPNPKLLTNLRRTDLRLVFGETHHSRFYRPTDSIIIEADDSDCLTAIWIKDIVDDLAGQEIATFRKQIRGTERFFGQRK